MNEAALYGLYALLAAGAAGLYLALPSARQDERSLGRVGMILGLAALAGVGAYLVRWIGAGFEGRAFFVLFAMMGVLAAARVVTHRRPVYSAMYFIIVVLAAAGLSILAAAEFLGAALVIIYGGAILVTYVFVIMLAQQTGEAGYDRRSREPFGAVLIGFLLVAAATQALIARDPIAADARRARPLYQLAAVPAVNEGATPGDAGTDSTAAAGAKAPSGVPVGNTRAVGRILLTTYVMAVEVAGVLLLVAVVGAIAIARRRIEPDALTAEERLAASTREDLHRRGREAKPF